MVFPGGLVAQVLFRPKRQIGPYSTSAGQQPAGGQSPVITAMVTIEEDHRDEMMVTDHPVELGAFVSDHAFALPSQLRIRAGWSKSPNLTVAGLASLMQAGAQAVNLISGITGAELAPGGSLDYCQTVYAQLRGLMLARVPMDVYTGKRIYSDMLLISIGTTTNETTENALIVDMEFRQVILVQTRNIAAPSKNQAMPEKTGAEVSRGEVQPVPSAGISP